MLRIELVSVLREWIVKKCIYARRGTEIGACWRNYGTVKAEVFTPGQSEAVVFNDLAQNAVFLEKRGKGIRGMQKAGREARWRVLFFSSYPQIPLIAEIG